MGLRVQHVLNQEQERQAYGRFHAVVLLVIGFAAVWIPLYVYFIMSGIWRVWQSGLISEMFTSMATIVITFMLLFSPLIMYWIDVMDTAYRSACDE